MPISKSTAWALLAQRAVDEAVVAKFFFGDGTDFLRMSSVPIQLDGEDYLPLIADMPVRAASMDYWTREFSISDISLSIINSPFQGSTRFTDLLDLSGSGNDRGYTNRNLEVRLWRRGITAFDDCLELFNAVTRQPVNDRNIAVVNGQDRTRLDLDITLDTMTAADAEDVILPEVTEGLLQPFIFGRHLFGRGQNENDNLPSISDAVAEHTNNTVRARKLGKAGGIGVPVGFGGGMTWLLAKNKMFSSGLGTALDKIWAFDPDLNELVRVDKRDVSEIIQAPGEDRMVIVVKPNPRYIAYYYGNGELSNESNLNGGDWGSDTRMNDKRYGDAALSNINGVGIGVVVRSQIDINFDGFRSPVDDLLINDVQGRCKIKWGKAVTLPVGQIVFTISGISLLGEPEDTDVLVDLGSLGGGNDEAEVNTNETALHSVEDAGLRNTTARIYEFHKAIEYTRPDDVLDIYSAIDGGEYDTWIDNRGTGDGFTVAHIDDGSSGSMIANRAGIIEAYLRVVLGLSTSQIDEEAFNLASTILDGVDGSYSIENIGADDALEELFRLVQSYECFIWWDATGKVSIRALPDTVTEADFTLNGDFIRDIKYSQTNLSNLYTGVEIEYAGYARGGRAVTTLVQDASAQEANNVTLVQSQIKLPSIGYRTSADATAFGNRLLANYKNPHNIIKATLPPIYADVDQGAIIDFENIPLTLRGEDLTQSYTIGGQTVLPFFLILDTDRSNGLKIKAVQLHDLT